MTTGGFFEIENWMCADGDAENPAGDWSDEMLEYLRICASEGLHTDDKEGRILTGEILVRARELHAQRLKAMGLSAPDYYPGEDRGEQPPADSQLELNALNGDAQILDNGFDDPSTIPPRGWLLGNLFARKYLSSLLGDGATGKTALRVLCALSLASGKRLPGLDEHVFQRSRVLYLCFEDGLEELRRRVRAAEIHHNLTKEDTAGYLFLWAVTDPRLKLAIQQRSGRVVAGLLGAAIERQILRLGLDVVILDPLIKAHGVEESDNNAMDYVASILSGMAVRYDISIDFPHHTRKAAAVDEPGNADVGRGASAVKDAGRLIYTLAKMSPKDAEKLGVNDEDRRSLVRMDSAKVNITPGDPEARWFKLVGVQLHNGDVFYPNGDSVQTMELWRSAAKPVTGLDLSARRQKVRRVFFDLLNRFNRGGNNLSTSTTAKNYAPIVFVRSGYAEGITVKEFEKAMQEMIYLAEIKMVDLPGRNAGRTIVPVAS